MPRISRRQAALNAADNAEWLLDNGPRDMLNEQIADALIADLRAVAHGGEPHNVRDLFVEYGLTPIA